MLAKVVIALALTVVYAQDHHGHDQGYAHAYSSQSILISNGHQESSDHGQHEVSLGHQGNRIHGYHEISQGHHELAQSHREPSNEYKEISKGHQGISLGHHVGEKVVYFQPVQHHQAPAITLQHQGPAVALHPVQSGHQEYHGHQEHHSHQEQYVHQEQYGHQKQYGQQEQYDHQKQYGHQEHHGHQEQYGQQEHKVEYHAPPKYEYKYQIEDPHTGDNKFHHEAREGDAVKGVYSLHDSDGSVRTVQYTSDKHNGFKAIVKTATKHGHVYYQH